MNRVKDKNHKVNFFGALQFCIMANNPFDDFAQDFGASLPGLQNQAPPADGSGSVVGTATAGGAAPFSSTSFCVQQQVPPSTVVNQPQQFGQVPVSQQ